MATQKKRSPRAARRALEREVDKHVARKDRLAELSPGGAPERPIAVESAAIVEPSARASRCPRCDGPVHLDDHSARTHEGRALRVVRVSCAVCRASRDLFFVVAPRLLH